MLRVRADCDDVPPDVIDIVKTITSAGRRAVRSVRLRNDGMPSLHDWWRFLFSVAMISSNICIKDIYF